MKKQAEIKNIKNDRMPNAEQVLDLAKRYVDYWGYNVGDKIKLEILKYLKNKSYSSAHNIAAETVDRFEQTEKATDPQFRQVFFEDILKLIYDYRDKSLEIKDLYNKIGTELYKNKDALISSMDRYEFKIEITREDVNTRHQRIKEIEVSKNLVDLFNNQHTKHLFLPGSIFKNAREATLTSFEAIFTTNTIGSDGFTIYTNENNKQYLASTLQLKGGLEFYSNVMLSSIYTAILGRFNEEDINQELMKSPFILAEDSRRIDLILKYYRAREFMSVNALLLPLLEDVLRRIHFFFGVAVINYNKKNNGFNYFSSIGQMLNTDSGELFTAWLGECCGPNVIEYTDCLLNQKAGFTLRHYNAHGINNSDLDNQALATLCLNLFFILGLCNQPKLQKTTLQ